MIRIVIVLLCGTISYLNLFPMVFFLTLLQHALLGKVRPGMWIPSIAQFHSQTATWAFHCNEDEHLISNRKTNRANKIDSIVRVANTLRRVFNDRRARLMIVEDKYNSDEESHKFILHKISNILQHLSVIDVTIQLPRKHRSYQTDSNRTGQNEKRRQPGRLSRPKKNKEMKMGIDDEKEALITINAESSSASLLPAWFPFGPMLGCLLCWVPFSDFGCNREYLEALDVLMHDYTDTTFPPEEHTFLTSNLDLDRADDQEGEMELNILGMSSIVNWSKYLSQHPWYGEIQRAVFFLFYIVVPMTSVFVYVLLTEHEN